MAKCPRTRACDFFQNRLDVVPMFNEELRQRFCLDAKQPCARSLVFDRVASKQDLPDIKSMEAIQKQMNCLCPNDTEKAELIIRMLVQ